MLGYINDPSHEVKNVYIVLDYCNQGSLATYLNKRFVAMRLQHIQHVLRQIGGDVMLRLLS